MISETTLIPRYQETDKMGVIHHSVYPIYFEMGRVNYCNDLGIPFHKIEERGIGQAIIDLNVHYHKPAYFGEILRLETRLTTLTKVRTGFSYKIYNQNDELINEGTTLLVWLNREFKPINLTKEHNDIYLLLLNNLVE